MWKLLHTDMGAWGPYRGLLVLSSQCLTQLLRKFQSPLPRSGYLNVFSFTSRGRPDLPTLRGPKGSSSGNLASRRDIAGRTLSRAREPAAGRHAGATSLKLEEL